MTDDQKDLWAQPIAAHKRKGPKPSGHAGKPGSGPKGETCKTCKHLTRLTYSKTYLKCALVRKQWTSGTGSDVRAKDAACWKWDADETQP
jgi:hypothetical protein